MRLSAIHADGRVALPTILKALSTARRHDLRQIQGNLPSPTEGARNEEPPPRQDAWDQDPASRQEDLPQEAGLATVAVTLCDVGLRDGLQDDPVTLPPAERALLATLIADAGVPRVEVASFVNPRLVPQMAGAEEVLAALPDDRRWCGLVLNARGMERALATGVGEVHVSYPVTDGFARANQNTTAEAAAAAIPALVDAAHAAGRRVTVTLSCAFGCPFDGLVDPALVADHVARAAAAGADEVLLADTIGVGNPRQTTRLVADAVAATGAGRVGVHLHNTRNAGYANAVAALEAGATLLDGSLGGLGGCPFAPGATGNVVFEDLVFLCESKGFNTGIDIEKLISVRSILRSEMPGETLYGGLARAGLPDRKTSVAA